MLGTNVMGCQESPALLLRPPPRRPLRAAIFAHSEIAAHLSTLYEPREFVADGRSLNWMAAAEPGLVAVDRAAQISSHRFPLMKSSERIAALDNRQLVHRASHGKLDAQADD